MKIKNDQHRRKINDLQRELESYKAQGGNPISKLKFYMMGKPKIEQDFLNEEIDIEENKEN